MGNMMDQIREILKEVGGKITGIITGGTDVGIKGLEIVKNGNIHVYYTGRMPEDRYVLYDGIRKRKLENIPDTTVSRIHTSLLTNMERFKKPKLVVQLNLFEDVNT